MKYQPFRLNQHIYITHFPYPFGEISQKFSHHILGDTLVPQTNIPDPKSLKQILSGSLIEHFYTLFTAPVK